MYPMKGHIWYPTLFEVNVVPEPLILLTDQEITVKRGYISLTCIQICSLNKKDTLKDRVTRSSRPKNN